MSEMHSGDQDTAVQEISAERYRHIPFQQRLLNLQEDLQHVAQHVPEMDLPPGEDREAMLKHYTKLSEFTGLLANAADTYTLDNVSSLRRDLLPRAPLSARLEMHLEGGMDKQLLRELLTHDDGDPHELGTQIQELVDTLRAAYGARQERRL